MRKNHKFSKKKKFEFFFDWAGPGPLILGWDKSSGLVNSGEWINSLSTVHAEQWRWCNEEEEGRGADLLWLRGCAAGGCWPENGLDGDRPFFFFSMFFFFCSVLLCFCFFSVSSFVSHGAGLLSMTGRMVAAGGCFRVALVAAIQTVTGGSSSFLSFFVFTSKTWQWRWWWCCCSSCPCVLPLSTTSSSLYHGCAADSSRCWWQ